VHGCATSDLYTLFCSGRRRRCLRISHVRRRMEGCAAKRSSHKLGYYHARPILQTDGCLRSDPSNVQEKERQLELELDHILNFRHATRRGTTCCKLFVRCKRCPGSSVSCLPVPPTQPTQPFLGERGDTPYYGDARLRGTDLSFHGSAAA
jgi:hypothetical protein